MAGNGGSGAPTAWDQAPAAKGAAAPKGSAWDAPAAGAATPGATAWNAAPQQAAAAGGGNAALVAPKSGGAGGGVGGFLSRFAHDAVGAVTGLPGGFAHMGADTGRSVENLGKTLALQPVGSSKGLSFSEYTAKNFPILNDVAAPVVNAGRTAGGLAQMASHNHLGHGLADETIQKYSQHPFSSGLSDALGATVVLGGADAIAGKALGEDATTTGALGKAAGATQKVANLPVLPYEAAAGRVAAIPAVADAIDRVKSRGQVTDFRSANYTQPARQAAADAYKAFAPAANLSPTEQAALELTNRNDLGLIQPAMDKLAPADRATFVAKFAEQHPGADVTPEAVNLADKYSKGLLPADQSARLDNAAAAEKVLRDKMQADALAGKGMAGGAALNPEQLGFHPLSANIDAATEKAMQRLPDAQQLAKSLRAKADTMATALDQAKADHSATLDQAPGSQPTFQMGQHLGGLSEKATAADAAAVRAESLVQRIHDNVRAAAHDAALDPANAPARLRPMLYAAQDAAKVLREMGGPNAKIADEIAPTLAAVRQAGLDAEHVIGGTDSPAGTRLVRSGTPGEKPTGAQMRRLGNTTEFNAPGQAGLVVRRALEGVRNEFPQRVADPESGLVTGSGHDVGPGLTGSDLHAAAGMQGLVPYDPTKTAGSRYFPEGAGNVAPKDVTPDTLFMPKNVYDALAKQEPKIPDPNSAGAGFDRLNTLLRKNPLLLSPAYHLRIATSNAMMAGLSGDLSINPLELARQIRETGRLLKSGEAPRGLVRNGMFADEQAVADMRRAGQNQNVAQQAWHGPVNIGHKVSAAIDNFSRVMTYVGEKGKGYSDEEAVTRANKAIGNYDQLSPFEQNVLKRALPIYPWLKQVALVAGRLAKNHPIASMFALHAASLFDQNQPAGLPTFLRGAVHVGGGFLPTDLANPFASFTAPPGGFASPLVKAPVAALTGLNLNNFQQYSRPPGQPSSGALWKNPTELKYVLAGMNPLSKFARDQTLPNVQRYGTGEPKLTAGKTTPSPKPPAALTLAGIPVPEKVDLGAAAKKEAKFQASQIKAAKKYAAQRAKAGKG